MLYYSITVAVVYASASHTNGTNVNDTSAPFSRAQCPHSTPLSALNDMIPTNSKDFPIKIRLERGKMTNHLGGVFISNLVTEIRTFPVLM